MEYQYDIKLVGQYNKTAKADSVLLSLWILRLLYKFNEEIYVEVDDKDNFIIDENNDGDLIVTIYSNEARPRLILHKSVKPIRFKELVNNLNDIGNKYYIEVMDSAFQTLPSAFI